ncbi:hypothetical protein [Nitrosopumilus piranensis]|uniref:Uncharacterized protein n=1 Tax=Nitrosopumilus piranensis TaxID=1582439 RepID=A0A0C5BU57_9ARCH|nr:hypothetical protein [Nitrosopumilus piranensis]AJM91724.1 hypothetical protein NPIRD3C_0510 [Nitrosopumilus piranensis]
MKITEKNRLYVWLSILFGTSFIAGIILHFGIFPNFDIKIENDFPNWSTLLVEIIVGIGIALIIYDHTKKIESREAEDLKLAIRGTYYSIWNLYHAILPYSKSEEIRSDRLTGLQILTILQTIRTTLSKCAQSIDGTQIETIQVDLLEIQEIVRSSTDPRADIEKLWTSNSSRFITAMVEIKDITKNNFEPLIPKTSRAKWL